MNTPGRISGIHHITAIASSAQENLQFYEEILGLRLVKQTVNFDDPYTYHLYYGDAGGTPGTILTFFPWEQLQKGKPGAGMVTAIAFSIAASSVEFWIERLTGSGIAVNREQRFGDPVLKFTDPHGLPLELIGISNPPSVNIWSESPIPAEQAIFGFHSATSVLNNINRTQALLVRNMGMTLHDQKADRYRFKMNDNNSPGHFYDAVVIPDVQTGFQGGGTVHHIAFRTPSDSAQQGWQKRLSASGFSVTPVRDRKYFKSIYFHEPGGVLFEIATDLPGFSVDEKFENLGQALKLPDQYESNRQEIEERLPQLRPERVYAPE